MYIPMGLLYISNMHTPHTQGIKKRIAIGAIATSAIAFTNPPFAPDAASTEPTEQYIVRIGAHELQGDKPRPFSERVGDTYSLWTDIRCDNRECVNELTGKYESAHFIRTLENAGANN